MRTFTKEELKNIIDSHLLWLEGDPNGVRADLKCADLSCADLSCADLSYANLRCADLSGADLSCANLRDVNLSCANLSGADLSGANLRCANLSGADLSCADLRDVNLSGADLSGANLRCANLRDVNLSCAKNIFHPSACPEKGSFTGFKKIAVLKQSRKVDYAIAELLIPEDARRSSSTSRKCRCDKAVVVSITCLDGSTVVPMPDVTFVSSYDTEFIYTVGEMVQVDNFDDNRWNECAPGIHFFITREEAVRY